jgi:hypothetical protein
VQKVIQVEETGHVFGVTLVAAAVEVARTAAIGIAGDCPNTAVVEVGAADPQVGYISCVT